MIDSQQDRRLVALCLFSLFRGLETSVSLHRRQIIVTVLKLS